MIHFHICEVKVEGNGLGVCIGGVGTERWMAPVLGSGVPPLCWLGTG